MKKILLPFMASMMLLSVNGLSQTKPSTACANASSQVEMHKCLSEQYVKANQDLAIIYNKVLKQLKSRKNYVGIKHLESSQKDWLSSRKGLEHLYEELYQGGSMMPIAVLEFELESIRFRLVELTSLSKDLAR